MTGRAWPWTGRRAARRAWRPAERLRFSAARRLGALPSSWQLRLAREAPVSIDGQVLDPGLQLLLAVKRRRHLRLDVDRKRVADVIDTLAAAMDTVLAPPPPPPAASGATRVLTVAGFSTPESVLHDSKQDV